jgi:hypothetical protein
MICAMRTPLICWLLAFTRRSRTSDWAIPGGHTLDLYSHVLPGMQEDAAARVDEAFQIAQKKRAENIG